MPTDYVMFPVQEDRVPDVARFLYGADEATSEAMPEASDEPKVPPSEEQRNELLTRIYVESEPRFRRLLMLVADREDPTCPMAFGEISHTMGWPTARSLPGALGAFGRRTKHRYGGYWPLHRYWDHAEWSNFMTMDKDIAAFLVRLHAERGLPTD